MNPEYAVSEKDARQTECDNAMKNMKEEINNFLFSRLPGGLTLDEFEKIAVSVYSLMIDTWNKFV